MRAVTIAALFTVVGCAPSSAVINGQSVGRPTLAYTDHYYYAVTHYRAYPESRGASSGLHSYGGRIAGFACGADFNYETDYRGRSIQLLGNVQAVTQSAALLRVQQPAHMEVRDMGGRRHFRGSVGDDIGGLFIPHDRSSKVIDFAFDSSGLQGQIGSRMFNLAAVSDDTMSGTVRISTGQVLPFELRGVSSVWSMPAADQAAILPFMMTCSRVEEGRHVEGATTETTAPLLVVDFRG
ncbi:MAG: hypothetical protein JWN44_2337 [Myxococcales bacterium]|nr:hypothetical protein [Myxococcales bacterium]